MTDMHGTVLLIIILITKVGGIEIGPLISSKIACSYFIFLAYGLKCLKSYTNSILLKLKYKERYVFHLLLFIVI
jgi:hypothetical protein